MEVGVDNHCCLTFLKSENRQRLLVPHLCPNHVNTESGLDTGTGSKDPTHDGHGLDEASCISVSR